MVSKIISKLLPPEKKIFYDYFDQGADITCHAAKLFYEMIFNGYNEAQYIEAKNLKNKSSSNSKTTLNELNKTFITPIDREDIHDISMLLNKITKRIIRGCVNIKIYHLTSFPPILKQQAETLIKATSELKIIMGQLKMNSSLPEITETNHEMEEIESHGDEILLRAMDELLSGKYDALEVIKLRDIYRNIESALDSCFSVSDVILYISLKNS